MEEATQKIFLYEYENLMKEWDYEANKGLNPKKLTRGSNKNVSWICQKNPKHKWKARIFRRTKGTGCPYCAKLKVLPEESLAHLRKDLMEEWDYEKNEENGIYPEKLSIGSDKLVHWICKRNPEHRWKARVYNRTGKNETGCPECKGGSTNIDISRSVYALRKDLLEIWDYEKNKDSPKEVGICSAKEIHWVCKKNPEHTWTRSMTNIRENGKNVCPECEKLDTYNNSFGRHFKSETISWDNRKNKNSSYEYRLYSGKKAWFICKKCNHSWESSIKNIARGRGCPECAKKETESKGEKKIEIFLKKKNIDFKREVTFDNCKKDRNLRFDFQVNLKDDFFLLEYDGEQHFMEVEKYGGEEALEKTKERDKIKNTFCEKEKIKLVRIPYTKFDKIEDILEKIINKKINFKQYINFYTGECT